MDDEMPIFAKSIALSKLLLSIACLVVVITSFAQNNKFTLTGNIKMNTGEIFPYKIVFTESAGTIKGHSYTYSQPDDTKTAITGKLDRNNRTLDFKETEIVYSHDVRTKAYMCLIDAHAQYLQGASDRILRGQVTSTEADKTACTGGTVTFDNQAELKALFEPQEKFDTVIKMGRRPKEVSAPVIETPTPVTEAPVATDKITTGIEKTYEWHSDTAIIDVWDGGTTDGDQVTLEYNGKMYLEKYALVKTKKRLRIPVSKNGIDVLYILADNEGWDPPNTATLMLTDGAIQYNVVSYNNKGQVSVIKIKRAK